MSLPRVLGTDAEGTDHGAERPFRPVPEEGHGLALDRFRRGNLHHHAGAGAGDLLAAEDPGRPAAVPPLAEFGVDPVSEKNIVVKDGRFGPYITDGVTNIRCRVPPA